MEEIFMINQLMTYEVSTGYGDDYATGCLLDYAYFKDNYRLIAVDLSKQKVLDADPRAIQQIILHYWTKSKIICCSWKIKRNSIGVL